MRPRIIFLSTSHSYRTPAFEAAANRLNIDLISVVDAPGPLVQELPQGRAISFREEASALAALQKMAREAPVVAILAADDAGALLAAKASELLGLPHNAPAAAEAARDKFVMRTLLSRAGVPCPDFQLIYTDDDPGPVAAQLSYPLVIKPTRRSGSQGVIRINDSAELLVAIQRLSHLLGRVAADAGPPWPLLVEGYIPGVEVALEGLLDDGQLHILALFDKPDPLVGPFFEETLYVTPSRLSHEQQRAIADSTSLAAAALGLHRGPIHAELRINDQGAWLVEIAGRSIGGLCSQVLRFGVDSSLEELILRQAAGMPLGSLGREDAARGVMMIPIPAAGLLRHVHGVAGARATPGVEDVAITVPLHNMVTPLPEGDSYLGFIFARGSTPADVETSLRRAHAALEFVIEPVFSLAENRRPAASAPAD